MADLLVRDIDPKAISLLKARAERHGRSLQAEVKAILEAEAAMTDSTAWLKGIEDFRRRVRQGPGPDAIELLRESRDER